MAFLKQLGLVGGFLFLGLGGDVACGLAEEIAANAITVTPHRAVYDLTLARAKPGSGIEDVAGTLRFEWDDTCDGWALNQTLNLTINEGEDDEHTTTSTSASWESKDGSLYRFSGRQTATGEGPETYRGSATFATPGGKGLAHYVQPEAKDMPLEPGTLFPAAHTLLVLHKAQEGERLVTRSVFDGEDTEGVSLVSAFIGAPLAPDKAQGLLPKALRKSPLLTGATWPVQFAFFEPSSETGEPAYEMEMVLNAQGVVRTLKIDYGEFSIKGTLKKLERLKGPHCPAVPAVTDNGSGSRLSPG